MIPGLAEMLALDDPALVAVALSGAGPSVLALVREDAERIGRLIAGDLRPPRRRAAASMTRRSLAGVTGS